jgi:hypothetical protein
VNQPGGFVPLDAELGMDHCWGFSPQMSYLMSLFGADEPFGSAAGKLSTAVGFPVSPSAVQRTTEQIGERIPEEPGQLIEAKKQQESCEVMVIEADGTLSGQIHEEEGLRGHESLKQPLEYKEANLVVIEKYEDGERRERWTGARYGPRSEFETYAGKAGVAMGFLKACKAVFLGDGAHQNWELQQTHFPGATPILDFYHALEHLGTFTTLLTEEPRAYQDAQSWPQRLKDGEVLEVIAEMKGLLPQLSDTAEGWRQINYFQRNQHRMHYDLYRQLGYPIGSGLVEGQCKFVIAKRFKGSGMRWKRHDNECTLRTRLAYLNDQLPRYFAPLPQQWRPAA